MIAGPLYDEEGMVVADCDLRDGLPQSDGSTRSATTRRRDALERGRRPAAAESPRHRPCSTGRIGVRHASELG